MVTADDDGVALEQKRAEAKRWRGVHYDRRIGKFIAAICSHGVREHLGARMTAEEAGRLYLEARAERPVAYLRKRLGEAVEDRFNEVFDGCEKDGRGRPVVPDDTAVYTPDGQDFVVLRTIYRAQGSAKPGQKFPTQKGFHVWLSSCRVRGCGEEYETLTTVGKPVTGIVRTCKAHRGSSRRTWHSFGKYSDSTEDRQPMLSPKEEREQAEVNAARRAQQPKQKNDFEGLV